MEAFIKSKGVTLCPATRSPELIQLNIDRQRLYDSMTPAQRYKAKLSAHRPKTRRGRKKAE